MYFGSPLSVLAALMQGPASYVQAKREKERLDIENEIKKQQAADAKSKQRLAEALAQHKVEEDARKAAFEPIKAAFTMAATNPGGADQLLAQIPDSSLRDYPEYRELARGWKPTIEPAMPTDMPPIMAGLGGIPSLLPMYINGQVKPPRNSFARTAVRQPKTPEEIDAAIDALKALAGQRNASGAKSTAEAEAIPGVTKATIDNKNSSTAVNTAKAEAIPQETKASVALKGAQTAQAKANTADTKKKTELRPQEFDLKKYQVEQSARHQAAMEKLGWANHGTAEASLGERVRENLQKDARENLKLMIASNKAAKSGGKVSYRMGSENSDQAVGLGFGTIALQLHPDAVMRTIMNPKAWEKDPNGPKDKSGNPTADRFSKWGLHMRDTINGNSEQQATQASKGGSGGQWGSLEDLAKSYGVSVPKGGEAPATIRKTASGGFEIVTNGKAQPLGKKPPAAKSKPAAKPKSPSTKGDPDSESSAYFKLRPNASFADFKAAIDRSHPEWSGIANALYRKYRPRK